MEEISIFDILVNKFTLSSSIDPNSSYSLHKQKRYIVTLPNLDSLLKQLKIRQQFTLEKIKSGDKTKEKMNQKLANMLA